MVPKTVPFQGEVEWGLRDPNFNPLTLMREPAWPHPVFSSPTSLFVAGAPMGGRDASLVPRGSDEETGTESHLQSPQICAAMEKAPPLLSQTPGIRDDNRSPHHCLTTITPLTRGFKQLGPTPL